jgi:hypothetical protein
VLSLITTDFISRKKLVKFNLLNLASFFCSRSETSRVRRRLQERERKKIEKELDLLEIIRHRRMVTVHMFGKATQSQNSFAKKLATRVLSEHSTKSASDSTKNFDYLQELIYSQDKKDKRLVQCYIAQNRLRAKP